MTATTDRLRANAKLLGTVAQDLLLLAAALEASPPPPPPPPPPPGPVDVAALLAAYDFDAQILFNGAPVASARQMLQDGAYVVEDPNPAATMIRLEDGLGGRTYDFGGPLRSVHPVVYATFFPATNSVKIRTVWMNTNSETLADVTGDLEILIGHASPKSYKWPNLTIRLGTCPNKTFWIGPPQPVIFKRTMSELIASRMLPNFDPALVVPESTIAADYAWWKAKPHDLYESGGWSVGMGKAGARWDIGLHPSWFMRWLYTGDPRYTEMCITAADLAGSWRVQVTEGDPKRKYDRAQTIPALGRPISKFSRPDYNIFGGRSYPQNTIKVPKPLADYGWEFENSHSPDPFSIAWLMTGDPWYLRELQMWAGTSLFYANGELRGWAWQLRHLGRAAFFSPEGSPEKAYFTDALLDELAALTDERIKNPLRLIFPLHHCHPFPVGDTIRSSGGGPSEFVHGPTDEGACFQMDFMTQVLGELVEKGYPAGELLDFCGKWHTGPLDEGAALGSDKSKLTSVYGNPMRPGVDNWPVRPPFPAGQHGGHGPYFTTWDQVQAEYTPAALAVRVAQFDTLSGNFAVLSYAASTFLAGRSASGKVLHDWLKTVVHDKPGATNQFYLKAETAANLLPRP